MTMGMYREGGVYSAPYDEKEYFLQDRFYPGEFGMVVLLGIAALLLWSVAIYGITNEPHMNSNTNYTASTGSNAY